MSARKPKWFLLQALNYTLFMIIVWYFSFSPPYRQLAEEKSVVTLAFGHAGERIAECKVLSQQELEKLAPNMRKPTDCPRERSPITIELQLDNQAAIKDVFQAPGFYQDQSVDVYRNVNVASGKHLLSVWMNDDINVDGHTHRLDQSVNLLPAQRLVVSFDTTTNEFSIK